MTTTFNMWHGFLLVTVFGLLTITTIHLKSCIRVVTSHMCKTTLSFNAIIVSSEQFFYCCTIWTFFSFLNLTFRYRISSVIESWWDMFLTYTDRVHSSPPNIMHVATKVRMISRRYALLAWTHDNIRIGVTYDIME